MEWKKNFEIVSSIAFSTTFCAVYWAMHLTINLEIKINPVSKTSLWVRGYEVLGRIHKNKFACKKCWWRGGCGLEYWKDFVLDWQISSSIKWYLENRFLTRVCIPSRKGDGWINPSEKTFFFRQVTYKTLHDERKQWNFPFWIRQFIDVMCHFHSFDTYMKNVKNYLNLIELTD